MRMLTDPVFSSVCSPVRFLGPKRHAPLPLSIEELPQIHLILISHNHYDHLDLKSVRALQKRFPDLFWVVPDGVGRWMRKRGIERVIELSWWEEALLAIAPLQLKIQAVPAQHFSGRTPLDRDRTLWCGYVVEFTAQDLPLKRLYFAGDTGYNSRDFKEIGERCGPMDLSLIPIGCYVPRRFMAPVHVEPKHSVTIHQEVASKQSLAIHWGTFSLSEEPLERPPFDLFLEMRRACLDPSSFAALLPGKSLSW